MLSLMVRGCLPSWRILWSTEELSTIPGLWKLPQHWIMDHGIGSLEKTFKGTMNPPPPYPSLLHGEGPFQAIPWGT